MNFLSTVWGFLSVAIIAWITQMITAIWERRKKIEETKLAIYMSWVPFFAEVYSTARFPDTPAIEPRDFLKKKIEILSILQLMGPDDGIDAFTAFCDDAEKAYRRDSSFDAGAFHRRLTALNYALCCEIHNEKKEEQG
jgi:hypothetical protein